MKADTLVGHVDTLWRYPVKSMRGEELEEAFAGFAGIYGDRLYAFRSSAAPPGFPFLTGRELSQMLLYRPAYRHPEKMKQPPNLADAEALSPGLTTVYADASERAVDVETPTGDVLPIDDPLLLSRMQQGLHDRHHLTLLQSDRAMTDCRPISLFSTHTASQLSGEAGFPANKRRFRANIYLDLESQTGFGEDAFVGRTLRIGKTASFAVLGRDSRCKMITLDPDTGGATPEIMKRVAQDHEGKAGIYAAVLVEGIVRPGDEIFLAS